MQFKKIKPDSTILEIGSFCRDLNNSNWHINFKLNTKSDKNTFTISQLPILVRRRILNPSKPNSPAGLLKKINIINSFIWNQLEIGSCVNNYLKQQDDKNQWCFTFDYDNIKIYLPQLELARALFFHNAYLSRLSLVPNGLSQEFDIQVQSESVLINILPSSSLPIKARENEDVRRILSWILLDEHARKSYESIYKHQIQSGYDTDKHRIWQFKFDPPPLEGSNLTLRGHLDKKLNTYFVYEISEISNLKYNHARDVTFFDPKFKNTSSSAGHGSTKPQSTLESPNIDDDQLPNVDKSDFNIETQTIKFEFSKQIETTRTNNKHSNSMKISPYDSNDSFVCNVDISTDEASILGSAAPGDYSNLEKTNDCSSLHENKFSSYQAMLQILVNFKDCILIHTEMRKLPRIRRYKKHLLVDGTPRYMSYHIINYKNILYGLLEVDTSDNNNNLSTLLIKYNNSSNEFNKQLLRKLETELIKNSLVWPTSFMKNNFKNSFKRISHPKVTTSDQTTLKHKKALGWAIRIHVNMNHL